MGKQKYENGNGKKYTYSVSPREKTGAFNISRYVSGTLPTWRFFEERPDTGKYKKYKKEKKRMLFILSQKKTRLRFFDKLEILAGSGIFFSLIGQLLFSIKSIELYIFSTLPVAFLAIILFSNKFFKISMEK